MTTILIVDDKVENRYLLEVILKGHGYAVQSAGNGVEGLEVARKSPPRMIIADILMPAMDGFTFCRICKQDALLKDIPFIFYTATYTDPKDEEFGLSLGANQFIIKPMEPVQFMQIIEDVLAKYNAGKLESKPLQEITKEECYLKEYNETLIRKLESKMTDLERANQALRKSEAALICAYESTLEGWSRAMDLRDQETKGHTERTAAISIRLASLLGMSDEDIAQVRRGALLHDIGKMAISDNILRKPGPLNEEEWAKMRQHPSYAYDLLSSIEFLRPALDIPLCHHEKWDGTGYPHGLKGEEIPISARIFTLVDVWDALRSVRPYRPAWPKEVVIEYIQEQSGKYFDPKIVPVFIDMMKSEGLDTSDFEEDTDELD
jgi:putative two-component system response regulator